MESTITTSVSGGMGQRGVSHPHLGLSQLRDMGHAPQEPPLYRDPSIIFRMLL